LTVNVIQAGDVTVEVTSDRAKIKQAITDFLDEYNKAQALIDTNIASSTDAQGHVTAGTLAGESDAYGIASELRRQVNATFAFMSGTLNRLEDMGLTSNGDNDNLTLSDSAKLDEVLSANLSEVKHLFTHTSADETALTGLAVSLDAYLERLLGDDGTLIGKQDTLGTQSRDIDEQLTQQERQVQANRDRLITGFLAMEQAQARINQQLQFLTQRFASQ
jgi:flagellar capping protein FliD